MAITMWERLCAVFLLIVYNNNSILDYSTSKIVIVIKLFDSKKSRKVNYGKK